MAPARAEALFEPAERGFTAAPSTRGPWEETMMHGGAPSALLARAVEQVQPGHELAVTRLTIEFFGGVPVGDVTVEASLAKPGRRFQVVDATLDAGGRRACLARAVRLRRADLPDGAATSPGEIALLRAPDDCEALAPYVSREWEMFHPDATEIRHAGGEPGSGAVAAWIRLRGDLVPGEPPSPLARAAAAADFANGLSWILPWEDWLFVNTELTVHVHREPAGKWIGLDARTICDASGIGLSTGVLHDLRGPFGVCAQSLFVQPRP